MSCPVFFVRLDGICPNNADCWSFMNSIATTLPQIQLQLQLQLHPVHIRCSHTNDHKTHVTKHQ